MFRFALLLVALGTLFAIGAYYLPPGLLERLMKVGVGTIALVLCAVVPIAFAHKFAGQKPQGGAGAAA